MKPRSSFIYHSSSQTVGFVAVWIPAYLLAAALHSVSSVPSPLPPVYRALDPRKACRWRHGGRTALRGEVVGRIPGVRTFRCWMTLGRLLAIHRYIAETV